MKHLMVLGLTASVVALASCSSDELIQAPSSAGATPIAFNGVAVNKSTRSANAEITGTTIEDFVINGWIGSEKDGAITNSSVLTDETVKRELANGKTEYSDADTWSYTNKQYWTAGTYYFSAIAPASVMDETSGQVTDFDNVVPAVATEENKLENTGIYGAFSFNNTGDEYNGDAITAKINGANQDADEVKNLYTPLDIDLVYASATAKGEDHIGDKNDAVSLSFDHLLSRVAFQFTNGFSNNNTKLAIKNIIIYDVAKKGTVTIPTKSWDNTGESNTQNLLFGDVDKIVTAAAATSDVTNEGKSENYYLIPYTDAAKDYKVTFDIEQYTGDTLIATYNKVTTLPAVTMAAGNSYLYTLYLDPTTIGLKEITFGVTVTDWATDTKEAVSDYTKTETTSSGTSTPTGDQQ